MLLNIVIIKLIYYYHTSPGTGIHFPKTLIIHELIRQLEENIWLNAWVSKSGKDWAIPKLILRNQIKPPKQRTVYYHNS